jgi:hypothetical protein
LPELSFKRMQAASVRLGKCPVEAGHFSFLSRHRSLRSHCRA